MFARAGRYLGATSAAVLVAAVVLFPVLRWLVLNALGPSTEYHEPYVEGPGVTRISADHYAAEVGARVFVRYIIVRHKTNGDCTMDVHRYGEYVGGPRAGQEVQLDVTQLQFRGTNDLVHPRWPEQGLLLTPDMIPLGQDQQTLALYVMARYYCNPLDYVFPRYLQGGVRPDETERVYLTVKRKKE